MLVCEKNRDSTRKWRNPCLTILWQFDKSLLYGQIENYFIEETPYMSRWKQLHQGVHWKTRRSRLSHSQCSRYSSSMYHERRHSRTRLKWDSNPHSLLMPVQSLPVQLPVPVQLQRRVVNSFCSCYFPFRLKIWHARLSGSAKYILSISWKR